MSYNPVVVQAAVSNASNTLTLGSTTTVGNWLIAFGFNSQGELSVNSGWTIISTIDAAIACDIGAYCTLARRLVQSGDGTVFTPFTGPTACWVQAFGSEIVEVSGLDPLWVGSFQGVSMAIPDPSGPPVSNLSVSGTSGGAGTLALVYSGWYGSAATYGINYSGGWTSLASNQAGGAGACSENVASQTFATPESSVSVSASLAGGQTFYGMGSALILLGTAGAASNNGFWSSILSRASAPPPPPPTVTPTTLGFNVDGSTWTVPAGVNSIMFDWIIGGGGGGSQGTSFGQGGSGAGGGQGGYLRYYGPVACEPSDVFTFEIGSGGPGGSVPSTSRTPPPDGVNGSQTTVKKNGTVVVTIGGGYGAQPARNTGGMPPLGQIEAPYAIAGAGGNDTGIVGNWGLPGTPAQSGTDEWWGGGQGAPGPLIGSVGGQGGTWAEQLMPSLPLVGTPSGGSPPVATGTYQSGGAVGYGGGGGGSGYIAQNSTGAGAWAWNGGQGAPGYVELTFPSQGTTGGTAAWTLDPTVNWTDINAAGIGANNTYIFYGFNGLQYVNAVVTGTSGTKLGFFLGCWPIGYTGIGPVYTSRDYDGPIPVVAGQTLAWIVEEGNTNETYTGTVQVYNVNTGVEIGSFNYNITYVG